MSRLNADTTQIKAAVSTSISQVLRNGVMFIGAVAMMIMTSLKLSLLVIVVIPLIIVPLILYGRTVRRYSRIAQDEIAASSAFASENLSATRTMQAFTSEDAVANRYARGRPALLQRGGLADATPGHADGVGDLPHFWQHRRRALVWRA